MLSVTGIKLTTDSAAADTEYSVLCVRCVGCTTQPVSPGSVFKSRAYQPDEIQHLKLSTDKEKPYVISEESRWYSCQRLVS